MKGGGIFPINSPYIRDPSSYVYLPSSHLLRPPNIISCVYCKCYANTVFAALSAFASAETHTFVHVRIFEELPETVFSQSIGKGLI